MNEAEDTETLDISAQRVPNGPGAPEAGSPSDGAEALRHIRGRQVMWIMDVAEAICRSLA